MDKMYEDAIHERKSSGNNTGIVGTDANALSALDWNLASQDEEETPCPFDFYR
jgi:hypothetical protein